MDSLFLPKAKVDWPAILQLANQDTRKARTFRVLLSGGGTWIPGQRFVDAGCGYDVRTRCARLEDIGVPVEARSCGYSTLYERRIPPYFIDEYEQRRKHVA